MSSTAEYYKQSGKFSPLAFVYAILLILIAAPILAAVYTLAIWHIPFIYLNFLLAIGFGFALGFLIRTVVKKMGKVRNRTIGVILSMIVGFSALYIHWGMWLDLVVNTAQSGAGVFNLSESIALLSQPGALFSFIGEINSFGTWGFGDTLVSGMFLSIVWLIEAILIVGGALLFSGGQTDEPFCEINQEWFESKVLSRFAPFNSPEELKQSLESGDMTPLSDLLAHNSEETPHYSQLTLYANSTNENYLTISNMVAKIKDEEVSHDEQILIQNLKISEEISTMLEAKEGAAPIS